MWIHAKLSKNFEKGMPRKWGERYIIHKDYKVISNACRNFVKNVKAQNELRFARNTKGSKKKEII